MQETHLTDSHEQQIQDLFSRRLLVLNSSDPTCSGSSAGIMFILNREIINTTKVQMTILIPGRAAALTIQWHNERMLTILNVYTPNNMGKHPDFWNTITRKWRELCLHDPDFMLGDFNLTEDLLDGAPAKFDNENAIEVLRNIRSTLNLQDTWCLTFPHQKLFTHSSSSNKNSLS